MNLADALAAEPSRRIIYVIRGRPRHDDRPPLPAGHPETWGLLTRGTMLDGSPYDHPTFVAKRDDEAWREMLAMVANLAENPG